MDKARLMRRGARLLAAALVIGGIVSAVPGTGIARMLARLGGYADFGYVPQQCGSGASFARAISGDQVRVCQTTPAYTYSFIPGHLPFPLSGSVATLHLDLPGANKVFDGCCVADAPAGRDAFNASVFGAVGGNPLTGASTYVAPGYASVTETATVPAGASSYTLTYAITNISGAPLQIRPAVSVADYGLDTPAFTASPQTLTFTDPYLGGQVTLSAAGASSFTAGSDQRLATLTAPSAPAFDNVAHADADAAGLSSMAFAWDGATLAAGETRSYSVQIGLRQARELLLRLAGAAPSADAPTVVAAAVTDERPLAGRSVRWQAHGTGGSAPLDASGHAQLSIPAAAGGQFLYAYVDANGNGKQDADEEVAGGWIWTPRPAAPAPAATAAPVVNAVKPATVPPRVVAPSPKLSVPFHGTFKVKASQRRRACTGKVTLSLQLGKKVLAKKTVKLDKKCTYTTKFSVARTQVGTVHKLTVVVSFRGNHYIRRTTRKVTVKV